ncbi:MAG: GGDEF domain-containing protein [Hahellaceae bacterium]|nr:GGDEF domain-containing protein [Hahellaceae bacterium]
MDTIKKALFSLLAGLSLFFSVALQAAEPINLAGFEEATLGKHLRYFQEEKNVPMSLQEAINRFSAGETIQGTGNSISLGIGVRPVWLKATVKNTELNDTLYRLSIETPWLDHIDTWLVQGGRVLRHVVGGDALPFDQRPMPYRVFAFETGFPPGMTDLYFRIESLGPMAIPLRMSSVEAAITRDISSSYQYGLLYGVMGALAIYNIVLFLLIRQKVFGLYSLYLLGFVANSFSYTGQLHTYITADFGVHFQDWLDTFLMITYSVAGLHFARTLLNTRAYSPKLDKLTIAVATIIPLGIFVGALFNQLVFSLILAFILNSGFATLFIALGVAAYRAKADFALLFLFSSVQAAVCIGVSTMAVAGVLPYNDFTFKAIEVGMALEAVLLAVIIAQQFRMAQRDKLLAETYARTDALTGLLNRRGFQEMVDKLWENLSRNHRAVSIILLDIDHFKKINDTYGHLQGDQVLIALADCLQKTIRKGDVSARWGGEEFIMLLPETSQQEALVQAERLRKAIAALEIPYRNVTLSITGSLGVSGTLAMNDCAEHHYDFERMVRAADDALYASKNSGRNQVFYFPDVDNDNTIAVAIQ